jgi:hypothetical protein
MNPRKRRLARLEAAMDGLPPGYRWEDLTDEQLDRMSYGEDPVRVLRGDPRIPPTPQQVAERARMDALFATLTDAQIRRIAAGESPESVVGHPMPQ